MIAAKHAFNSGDLLTVLPGLRHIAHKNNSKVKILQVLNLPADYGHNNPHPVVNEGRQVCLNEYMFNMLKPLIESQDYIEGFDIWKGEKIDFDFNLTRHHSQMPLPGGSIHHWAFLIFPQLECDLSIPWLNVPNSDFDLPKNKVLINRTARYNNPYISYFFLKEFEKNLVFTGTTNEYEVFCKQWDLSIPYLHVRNFLDLASAIKSSKFFLGNQSFCWHISDAMKTPRILEVCSQYPNTFPTGANGHSFITQNALEWQFQKLLNETH